MQNRFVTPCRAALFFLMQFLLASAQAITVLDRAELTVEGGTDAPTEVSLPYNWDSAQGGASGWASYVLRFPMPDSASPQALFISKIGNTFQVILNGRMIADTGSHDNPHVDFSKQPHLLPIPDDLLWERNTLVLRIHAQSARHAGVSRIVLGDAIDVRALYEDFYRWRVNGSLIIAVISAVLGGLALVLWYRQRDTLYVYYGIGELLWALRVSDVLSERSPLPWPWWGGILFSAYALAPALICKFSLMLIDQHKGWLKRIGDWHMVLSVPVILLALLAGIPALLSVWLGVTILICVAVALLAVWHGARSSALERRVLAVAVLLTSAAAVRDMLVYRILPGSYGVSVTWTSFAWAAFGLTLAWVIAERLRKSTEKVADINRLLAQRLTSREAELKAIFASQAESEKQQAMTEERQRLTRDMHDGLGSQLLGALQLAQNDAVPREMLVRQLREALDHLKLTVDAMQDTEGDIATLLGALRYRLSPRLEAAGIALQWEVAPLPMMENWTVRHSRHLQMILFEAFSNMIAHAGASQARLRAWHDDEAGSAAIRITLADNGNGFLSEEEPESRGHGLANMRIRAGHIGAAIEWQSSPAGTCLSLALPLAWFDVRTESSFQADR